MRKSFLGIAAALITAAALWPVVADARPGGGGGGGGFRGGGGVMHGGFGGGGMRSFAGGGGMRSFGGGGGMRSFGAGGGMRAFSAPRSSAFVGSPMVRSGARFATGHAFHRGFSHRGHRFHRRFFPAFAFAAPLAYGAYSYYYDDDCYAWVEDWRYPTGYRRVYICY